MSERKLDAVVVGAGPNGLAAAITLARAGRSVRVIEATSFIGGGLRTEELTLPGFLHDTFSAVHPMAVASPFFRSLPLEHYGLEWILSPAPMAHAVGDTSVILEASVEKTAAQLGKDDWRYRRVFGPLVRKWEALFEDVMQPAFHLPRHPILLARFGAMAMLSAESFANGFFRDPKTRALIGGIAAHANTPLDRTGTAAIALMMMTAGHARGWPIPKGGAGSIAKALASYFAAQGGVIETDCEITRLSDLPPSRFVFFDLPPSRLKSMFESSGETAPLAKQFQNFRHGPGVFKIDWALSKPIPWADQKIASAATVHLGGPLEQIARSESRPSLGEHPRRPFVLLSQPTLFDPSRAPKDRHVAWAYCHVPHGSDRDVQTAIEDEIERYAPGFRSIVLARNVLNTKALEKKNMNLVGGDIGGGEFGFWKMIAPKRNGPYEISRERGYYICSSSAPPGPGIHGMCGFNAANAALRLDGKN
ncbi:MAG: NAD(P)/FAD-dependent oxidoreductase [Bdellovibrionota bacterium]